MYDPWEGVPSGWTVTRAAITTRGYCDHAHRLIVINAGLSRVEERCTLTHEIIHAERGPVPAHHAAREERIVDAEAAERLIPLDALLEAMRWACCPAERRVLAWISHPAHPGRDSNSAPHPKRVRGRGSRGGSVAALAVLVRDPPPVDEVPDPRSQEEQDHVHGDRMVFTGQPTAH